MAEVTAARLYKSTSNADYVILPAPALTVPSGGDYDELPLRVVAVDASIVPFTVTVRIARTLVSTSRWRPFDFLLLAGTLVAAWLIEQRSFADQTMLFHTNNIDPAGGLEPALDRLKAGLFEQQADRQPIGFHADFATRGSQPPRLSAFPFVSVDYTAQTQTGEEHRYQLGVMIEPPPMTIRDVGVDLWFPSPLMAGAEGFTGLGAKRVDGVECSGFRWRSDSAVLAGQHVRVCSTRETKLTKLMYRVNDDLYQWIDESQPAMEIEVFAAGYRLRALIPVQSLHQF